MNGTRLSEISNIMSLQSQAAPPRLRNEPKGDREKGEDIPMHEGTDSTIEKYLHEKNASDQSDSQSSKKFIEIENLIKDTLSKTVSQQDQDTVGESLATLAESIQQALEEAKKGDDYLTNHPKVELSSGFIIDLICGTITLNISSLSNITKPEESTDEFINALKSKKEENTLPGFQDILVGTGKIPSELELQKDDDDKKQSAKSASNKIKKQQTNLQTTYQQIDTNEELGLLG